jgi:glycosyltransferase involved in cell wall biosynthesis
MNVLFYSSLPMSRHGGVARWMQQMVTTLRGAGHRVHVLTWGSAPLIRLASGPEGARADQRWGPDLHVVSIDSKSASLPLLRFWLPLFGVARAGRLLVQQEDIQVIHTVAVYETYSAALARGAGPAALVLSVHGDYVTEQNQRWRSRWRRRLYLPVERAAFRQCQAVTTSSHWLQARLAAQIGHARSVVIPNGIAVPSGEVTGADRVALGLPEGRRIVLTVNNLYAPYRRQGLALLAAAAPSIVERIPDVLFVVVGGVNDPARDKESLQWASMLTEGLPFLFTGYRGRSPADLMAAADLYLHSTTLDNSPTVVLEAMALGTPIVSTAVGGIPEMVSHEQTGLLVPLEPGMLASATVRLLEDRPFALALAQRARERVQCELTWARTGLQFTGLYEEVVRMRSRAQLGPVLEARQGQSGEAGE